MKPVDKINNVSARKTKEVKIRPFTESGMQNLREWFVHQTWEEVGREESAHDKARIFQELLLSALDKYLPEKIRKINSDDQAWITHKLKILDRKRKRVFRKERRSGRWRKLNKMFKEEIKL